MQKTILDTPFKQEVYDGLTSPTKHLSSKFIYDKKGDKLFQDIMNMPTYYLTNKEYTILDTYKGGLAAHFSKDHRSFQLIEMGAGDGKKTKILLRHFLAQKLQFNYCPIDISQNALDTLQQNLANEIPTLEVVPKQGTYFETLKELHITNTARKVILFLGSNIGNLLHEQAIAFLSQVQTYMAPDDLLFVGFDQKKNPQTVLDAYNDAEGITEQFNKNLLVRINDTLGGNFNTDAFLHWETYNPETGTAKSFLVSKKAQNAHIKALDLSITFKAWETIHTEISQKYDDDTVAWLAKKSGLSVIETFSDEQNYYKNYLFKKSI